MPETEERHPITQGADKHTKGTANIG
jgi:hypothetical protein